MKESRLKIGLAMGGGTSMGIFTGTALTEAIKQILVFGTDKFGNLYTDIEIDVMTGASAGSVSLAFLMRSLIDIDDILSFSENKIVRKLENQFGKCFLALTESKKEALIRLQKAQELQIKIWKEELEIKNFLKDDGHLDETGGVFNSKIFEEISHKYMFPPTNNKRILLGKRVLVHNTLSRLAAFRHDARSKFLNKNADISLLDALGDGLVSYEHHDGRTFDIRFAFSEEHTVKQPKWLTYCSEKNKEQFAAFDYSLWATLAATAIASGAFPFALEPTVLMRKKEEYGDLWPKELAKFNKYPFTYIDGGLLNNEPIREAFNLARVLDESDIGFERKIIFIDPNVKENQGGFNPGIHAQFYFPDYSFKFQDLGIKNTHQRLASFVSPMINMYYHQSKMIEADKILSVKERFELRKEFQQNLVTILPEKPTLKQIIQIKNDCEFQLEGNKKRAHSKESLWVFLQKIIVNYPNSFFKKISTDKALETFFLEVKNETEISEPKYWYAALWLLYSDFILGLHNKDVNAELIAIASYDFENKRIIRLPGAEVAGFAGFASPKIADFTVKFAKYMTAEFLKAGKVISKRAQTGCPEVDFLTFDRVKKNKVFQQNMQNLYDRIEDVITGGKFSFEVIWKLGSVRKMLISFLENLNTQMSYEFRIEIPRWLEKKLELDGKDFFDNDLKPILINQKFYLITFANFDLKTKKWEGIHLNKNGFLSVDYNGENESFCKIQMPNIKQVNNINLMPNPFFKTRLSLKDKHQTLKNSCWVTNHFGISAMDDELTKHFENLTKNKI